MHHLVSPSSGLLAVLIVLAGAATAAPDAAPERQALSFGVVPQQSPSKLLRSWGPLLRSLERRTGYRFIFRTAPDIPSFEQRLADEEYDLAYMNPYHFTVFNRGEHGYQAVARARDKRIRGIVVVRQDSPLRSLSDLEGAALAFPAPAAFAASVLPRAHLLSEGIGIDPRYVSSHDSVYKTVAREFFVAGGGVLRTFQATDPEVRGRLRILWTTPGYTPHAIAAHPRIRADVAAAVREALIHLGDDEAGRAAIAGLRIKGFRAASNSDWDDVRALGIDTRLGSPR